MSETKIGEYKTWEDLKAAEQAMTNVIDDVVERAVQELMPVRPLSGQPARIEPKLNKRIKRVAGFSGATDVLTWMRAQTYKTVDGSMADMVVSAAREMRSRIKLKAKYYRKRRRNGPPSPEIKARLNAMNKARAAGRPASDWKLFMPAVH